MKIEELFKKSQVVNDYQKALAQANFSINAVNCSSNHGYLLTYLTYLEKNETVVYVASNTYKASHAYEIFCHLASPDNVDYYTTDEIVSTELLAVSNDLRFERIKTLKNIINNKPKIIVTCLQPLIRPLPSLDDFRSSVITINEQDRIDVSVLVKTLIQSGYKKRPTCEMIGEFAIRGEIIDIYPLFYDYPIRIDFFDDEVEFIKMYNPETQISSTKIPNCTIYPISDLVYSEEEATNTYQLLLPYTESLGTDLDDIINYNNPERVTKYIDYLKGRHYNFLDYIDEKTVIYENYTQIKEQYEQLMVEVYNVQKQVNLNLLYFDDYYSILKPKQKVFISEYLSSLNDIALSNIIDIKGYVVTTYQDNIKSFIEEIKHSPLFKTTIICASDEKKFDMIQSMLSSSIKVHTINTLSEIEANKINLGVFENAICYGFDEYQVITENELFKGLTNKKVRFATAQYKNTTINSKDELKLGDYIVHYDYGIGIYLGLKTVELNGIKNDYLLLKYENMELYVPVEKIDLLEKYQGSEGSKPKLSKIGTDEWRRRREKVREKVEKIAQDLVKTELERNSKKGYVYQSDDELQIDFEKGFEYTETPDQLQAITDIKSDMEKGLIIDRLICGDVGYGKTEIAMRAAFKTVLAGKQVAYLAPTTILTRQHYYTFLERFSKYGITVKMLNRLVSLKEQSQIIQDLKQHNVDIVIGTHRMLSDDVRFADLGLLIIDEEQRFGVLHKEKIKKLKTDINVLTLSATPIPRTLQMSIMGIRQFSLIQTPPKDRFPIQTYVLEYNDNIVKEAIYKELARNGQVFYLHNRISTLSLTVKKIQKLVPEAKVCFAHGRMDREELEDIIQAFIDKEYDCLVCTTIIETGIDIPNSNTLIIDQVDSLGLSQLYQIRGRIGRSDKIAYAYLMFEKGKVLTQSGTQRLNAIKEFTNLGSGYKIALRDLAIRGAGDVLGSEQSGFIDMIGMDMYVKMLNTSLSKLKNEEIEPEKIRYNVEVAKHVSEKYVSDEEIKILIHEKINSISSKLAKENLINELNDRFGKLSKEILLYIEEKYLESLLNKFSIPEIDEEESSVKITFPEEVSASLDGGKVFTLANKINKEFYFLYKNNQLTIKLNKTPNSKNWIYSYARLLEQLL